MTNLFKRRKLPAAQNNASSALKCSIGYNKYGGYCLPLSSSHRTAPRKILRGLVYEPQTLEFMRGNCGTGDIVHAGTYFGDFLPALSQACSPEGKIWAFEPNSENFKCARITVLINDLENVALHNVGLGDKTETLRMRIKDETGRSLGGKSRIVGSEEFNPAQDEQVEVVSIDDIVDRDRQVSIIQLDVEDHEQAALAGALQTIHRCLPIIIVEVRHDSELLGSAWFKQNILDRGYKLTGTLHGNSVFQHIN